jgi:CspA family cold shock protein
LTANYCNIRARRGAEAVVPLLCPTCFLKKGPLPKERGTVKWFDPRKHFGFIVTEQGDEVFFHQRQLLGVDREEVQEGEAARFHVRSGAKGPEAVNVELVEA